MKTVEKALFVRGELERIADAKPSFSDVSRNAINLRNAAYIAEPATLAALYDAVKEHRPS